MKIDHATLRSTFRDGLTFARFFAWIALPATILFQGLRIYEQHEPNKIKAAWVAEGSTITSDNQLEVRYTVALTDVCIARAANGLARVDPRDQKTVIVSALTNAPFVNGVTPEMVQDRPNETVVYNLKPTKAGEAPVTVHYVGRLPLPRVLEPGSNWRPTLELSQEGCGWFREIFPVATSLVIGPVITVAPPTKKESN